MNLKTLIPVEMHSISVIDFDNGDESIVLSRSNSKPGVLILTVTTSRTTRWFALDECQLRPLLELKPDDDEEFD